MVTSIPSALEVRSRLVEMTTAQLKALADTSGAPFTTLWKIRSGETKNPGIETVRQFLPHLGQRAAPSCATIRPPCGVLAEPVGASDAP